MRPLLNWRGTVFLLTMHQYPMRDTEWRDRRVLVTGARGFIASNLCNRLINAGADVHGASRWPPEQDNRSIHWWASDLSDEGAARRLLQEVRPDFVFHLAGRVDGTQRIETVKTTFEANLASTVHLLTAASTAPGCRIMLSGSMQEPHTGDPMAVPCSPYAASKWACSGYARMFHALYGI